MINYGLVKNNPEFSLLRISVDISCAQDEKQGNLTETVKGLFHTFDHNKDGKIQQEELRGLIVGIGLDEAG